MKSLILCSAFLAVLATSPSNAQQSTSDVSSSLSADQAVVFQLRTDIAAASEEGKSDAEIAGLISTAMAKISTVSILNALANTVMTAGASSNASISGITAGQVQAAINAGASNEVISNIITKAVASNPEAAADIQTAVIASGADQSITDIAVVTGLSQSEAPATGAPSDSANTPAVISTPAPIVVPTSSAVSSISPN